VSSREQVCSNCNAIASSSAEFCRECGTALPSISLGSDELLAQAKKALAEADYEAALRACAAAKVLDPNNSEISQMMAAAQAALGVASDQKAEEESGPDEDDSDSYRKKSKTRKLFNFVLAWGAVAIIVIVVLAIVNTPDDENTSGSSSSSGSAISSGSQSNPAPNDVPATLVTIAQYHGCDGLEDLIPKLKSVGGSSLGYYQIVQAGDNALCDDTISKLNKPELLKD
jgi:hypothetical protein